ncbi:MAG: NAD(P)-binding protein, partial [Brachybacterium sp.]
MDATLPADGLDGTTHDVVIIGAGFSGLAMLQTLRSTNIDALLLEAGDDIGGTWSGLTPFPRSGGSESRPVA